MGDLRTLLPVNSPELLKALSEAFAEHLQAEETGLAHLWDPRRAPAQRLASLAADLGVPLWNPAWSDSKKRHVIASAVRLMRRRGTRQSFESYLRFVDAELVGFRTPPQVAAARRHPTPERRSAWAAQFPELRVHRPRIRHVRTNRLVLGRCWGGVRRTPVAEIAAQFSAPRAVLVRDGLQQPVRVHEIRDAAGLAPTHLQVAISSSTPVTTANRPAGRGFVLRRSTAGQRLYNYTAGPGRVDVLTPSTTPQLIAPAAGKSRVARKGAIVPGAAVGGARRFLRRSRAREQTYESLRLFDPALAASGRIRPRGGFTLGRTRLGQPAFELHLDVDLSQRQEGRRPFPFSTRGPLRSHDPSRMADGLAAARAAKLGRDRVLVRTGLYRPITVADSIPLDGSYRLGQIVRSL
jgi:phage tail-like protein